MHYQQFKDDQQNNYIQDFYLPKQYEEQRDYKIENKTSSQIKVAEDKKFNDMNNQIEKINKIITNNNNNNNNDNQNNDQLEQQQSTNQSCFPDLTYKERLLGFVVCYLLGCLLQILSAGVFISALTGSPAKFAITFTLGNIVSLTATGFLCGLQQQYSTMVTNKNVYLTFVYISSIIATLISALFFNKNTSAIGDEEQLIKYIIMSVHLICLVSIILVLGIITEEYLLPCLECLGDQFQLSTQHKGLVLALGLSVPEMTTSVLSVRSQDKAMVEYAFGAIVGSGVFDFTLCLGIMAIYSNYYHHQIIIGLADKCLQYNSHPILCFFIICVIIYWVTNFTIYSVTVIVNNAHFSHSFVGLTFSSWGGNIADIMNGVSSAKLKRTELMTSTILGSQLINLNLCLGVPWLVFNVSSGTLRFPHSTIFTSMLTVFLVLLLSYIICIYNKYALNYALGSQLILVYAIYFTFQYYHDLYTH